MNAVKRIALALTCSGFLVASVWGFALLDSRWPAGTVVVHLQLGPSPGRLFDNSASWGEVVEGTLKLWSDQLLDTRFIVVRDSTAEIGPANGVNNVIFAPNIYGQEFGNAVAVAVSWRQNGVNSEGDVLFDENRDWNSYRGPLRRSNAGGAILDIRRVALHEFGHMLGLGHPDEAGENVKAVMNSRVSDLETLQDDDIIGAQSLYGKGREIAAVKQPGRSLVSTKKRKYSVRGTATLGQVTQVFLRNNRIRGKTYRAFGVDRWQAGVKLLPGVNRITVRVRTSSNRLLTVAEIRIRQK